MSNRFVWVDIPARDLDRAIAFYAAVFGQAIDKDSGPGFAMGVLPHAGDDVGGCIYVSDEHVPSRNGPLIYLNVEGRLAEAVDAVGRHGGEVLQAVHAIGPHGWRAIVLDSEGNRIALHAPPGDG